MTIKASQRKDLASADLWFPALKSCDSAHLRLFCFPFAGGSAATFGAWGQSLLPGVELRALQLPGRGNRIGETPVPQIATLRPYLLRAIESFADKPMVFFGHSNGALVAYDVALHLPATQRKALKLLVLSAKSAPHCGTRHNWHLMNDADLTHELKTLGGTPPGLLAHEEFMQLLLPVMRADFALSATYAVEASPAVLDVPVALWWASHDSLVREQNVLAWRSYFARSPYTQMFDGGHFYLNEHRELLIQTLNRHLQHILATLSTNDTATNPPAGDQMAAGRSQDQSA